MSIHNTLKAAVCCSLATAITLALFGMSSSASAQADPAMARAFSSPYMPVGSASPQQAQIVYYRPGLAASSMQPNVDQGANVYVDGEFQAALLMGGYSAFCVNPGMHAIGAFLHEAPAYRGKTERMVAESYTAGQTYFFKVREDGSGVPIIVPQMQAEQELQSIRKQVHALSRSSSVTPCQGVTQQALPVAPMPPMPTAAAMPGSGHSAMQTAPMSPRNEPTQREVRFEFAKASSQGMRSEDRSALVALARQVSAQGAQSDRLVAIGHADQIGSADSAYKLGMLRANAVRGLLISNGVPAERISVRSVGNTEPVVMNCGEDIACAAPNRRVVVRVEPKRIN